MNILRFMGCTSHQFGSTERYLLLSSELSKAQNHNIIICYNNLPEVNIFLKKLKDIDIKVINLGLEGRFNPKYILKIAYILKNKIDLVHGYFAQGFHLIYLVSLMLKNSYN